MIFNSPSNPTGAAYTRAELEAIGAVLRRHPRVVVATDDMYEHIYWAPEPFCSFLTACPDLYDRTVTINGVSKSYAMTGWRIGYCGGPVEIVTAMSTIQSQSTSNPSSIAQKAAAAALNGDQACVGDRLECLCHRSPWLRPPGAQVRQGKAGSCLLRRARLVESILPFARKVIDLALARLLDKSACLNAPRQHIPTILGCDLRVIAQFN